MNMEGLASVESKALRLARYLKEYVSLRSSTILDVNKYESVLWFADMPHEPECQSPAWSDSFATGDPWLVVRKQEFPKPPVPPQSILPWIDQQALKVAAIEMPQLRRTRLVPDLEAKIGEGEEPPLIEQRIDDNPEVVSAYERHRPAWEAWSAEYQRRSRIQSVYAELFRLHTQVQKQGELVEIVLGLGLLSWRNRNNGKAGAVIRHIVTARVDLRFDPTTGVIQLDGAAEGARLKVEDDMLDPELRPERGHYAAVGAQLAAIGDDVWNRPSIFSALRAWAGALNPNTEWSPELKIVVAVDNKPTVSFAPALIMRKRTQVGMVRIYDALIERISIGNEALPEGWAGLIDDEDDHDRKVPAQPDGVKPAPSFPPLQEIYFPLPANREQRRIVEAISHRRGVLVQGPPGTGKSHTIANLVCHLLATGKRVLITAETGRALKVLKSKLPEEIQPLCVSLLGQGGDAFAELNAAVQGISSRHATWMPGAYDERIADVERDLDARRRSLAKVDMELRSIREDETCPHSLMGGAYLGTASTIAQRVAGERNSFEWIALPRDAADDPPISSADMRAWLSVRRTYDDHTVQASRLHVVGADRLPAPAEFSARVMDEREANAAAERIADQRLHPAYGSLSALNADQRSALAERLRELRDRRRRLLRPGYEWLRPALADTLDGRQARWQMLVEHSTEIIGRIGELLNRVGSSAVSIPLSRDARAVRADAGAVLDYLQAGGKWSAFGVLTPKPVKGRTYLRDQVTVDGQPADAPERLRLVCAHLDVALAFGDLELAWSDHGGLPGGAQPRLRMVAIQEHVGILAATLDYARTCLEVGRQLSRALPSLPEPDWLDGRADAWLELIDASAFEERRRLTTERTEAGLRDLRAARELHATHPVVSMLIQAIERRDVTAYSQAYNQTQQIEQTRRDQQLRQRVESALETAAPGLCNAVARTIDAPAWDERFTVWEKAWRWAVADAWLAKRTDFSYRQQLWQRRREIDNEVGRLLAEAAALRAWTHFFNRLSHAESAALRSWREAVKALGKGTGSSARSERLRREARQYMDQCRDAIPIWIMPRYLVAEMIDPVPGRYDLVIVDEASQLGIESLFLFYISKKMVVVGDDQQISPYGIGVADESIAELQHHYLDGIPHHHALSAQSSLYGNAKIRFGQSIVLREHFRCMPEIIQFSNDLCYASNGTPLDPLRAYPANRLKPIVVRHVPDGYRTGSAQNALNEPEADAIVAQIQACIADARYGGQTMGVISLQGEAQAKLIEHKLLELLEPEVIDERRLICGDAYAFQGDERNVIFLTMVAAPGMTRIGVLSNDSARQRFNVAASRAQDQLWLFHTPTLDILSPACMRHRLLGYMLNPGRETSGEKTHKFDSQFERDVFEMIVNRGFHVRTQVCVGDPTNHRYRIDLVVEGMQGRIAVECDGDAWHGPDRYEQDQARQRDLERAGWQFVRIRGGDFYRDRDRATEPLWQELDRLGVSPGGIDEAVAEPPSPVDRQYAGGREGDETFAVDSSPSDDAAAIEDAEFADDETGAEQELVPERHQPELIPAAPITAVNRSNGHIEEYVVFGGSTWPDPRTVNLGQVADGLCAIIEVEGPMIAKRAYDIYLRGCGIRRLGGELKSTMNKALANAIHQKRVVSDNEPGQSGLIFSTVRKAGSPPVRLRTKGSRHFEDIPPGELRAMSNYLIEQYQFEFGSQSHLRAILEGYGLKRLTAQVEATLLEVLKHKPSPTVAL